MNALTIIPPVRIHLAKPSQLATVSIHRQVAGTLAQVVIGGVLGYGVLTMLLAMGTPGPLAAMLGAVAGAGLFARLLKGGAA